MSLLGLDQKLREVAGVAVDGSEGVYLYQSQQEVWPNSEQTDPPFGFDFRRSDTKGEGHRIHLLRLPCA